MRRSHILAMLAAITAIAALSSCGSKNYPIEKIEWEEDGNGYVQFRTNDPDDYNRLITEIPTPVENTLPAAAWTVEADVLQLSGTTAGGHGLVFYYDPDLPHDFLGFLLRVNGQFRTINRINGIVTLGAWTDNGYIKGPSQVNTIRAVYNGSDTISVQINGHAATSIPATCAFASQAGFINEIRDDIYEGFPRYYSDRRFKLKIIAPTSYTYPVP